MTYSIPTGLHTHMVYVKKNTTHAPRQHLKTRRHVSRFLPPCAPHFDGRAAVRRLVKGHNPWITALFCREKTVRSPNCGAFGKKRRSTLPAQIQRQTIELQRVFLSKHSTQNLTNCILFDIIYVGVQRRCTA